MRVGSRYEYLERIEGEEEVLECLPSSSGIKEQYLHLPDSKENSLHVSRKSYYFTDTITDPFPVL